MGQKFQVGDVVINQPYPDRIGVVYTSEADEYSFDNYHYGVCWHDFSGEGEHKHVLIPYDNYKFLLKFAEGLRFDTESQKGCVVTGAPDPEGYFEGKDSDGIVYLFTARMVRRYYE